MHRVQSVKAEPLSIDFFFLVEVQLPMLILTALKIPINMARLLTFPEMTKKKLQIKALPGYCCCEGPVAVMSDMAVYVKLDMNSIKC